MRWRTSLNRMISASSSGSTLPIQADFPRRSENANTRMRSEGNAARDAFGSIAAAVADDVDAQRVARVVQGQQVGKLGLQLRGAVVHHQQNVDVRCVVAPLFATREKQRLQRHAQRIPEISESGDRDRQPENHVHAGSPQQSERAGAGALVAVVAEHALCRGQPGMTELFAADGQAVPPDPSREGSVRRSRSSPTCGARDDRDATRGRSGPAARTVHGCTRSPGPRP